MENRDLQSIFLASGPARAGDVSADNVELSSMQSEFINIILKLQCQSVELIKAVSENKRCLEHAEGKLIKLERVMSEFKRGCNIIGGAVYEREAGSLNVLGDKAKDSNAVLCKLCLKNGQKVNVVYKGKGKAWCPVCGISCPESD
ncbi:hypothetical protein NG99_03000 [Erwinia typographi]|uniref:Uncharacterized protein n=1 Tax=Erwinia typographi TaxID=371042 RepID=A0A0A3Z9H3_9GAMM|nr:hypothetical protein [Erwinia typographi]KGT95495.1 hypothetical protein NG99_03000 [Erwinia typographi]